MITIVARGSAQADRVRGPRGACPGPGRSVQKRGRKRLVRLLCRPRGPREVHVHRGLERSGRDRPPQREPPFPGLRGEGSTVIRRSARHRPVSETHLHRRFGDGRRPRMCPRRQPLRGDRRRYESPAGSPPGWGWGQQPYPRSMVDASTIRHRGTVPLRHLSGTPAPVLLSPGSCSSAPVTLQAPTHLAGSACSVSYPYLRRWRRPRCRKRPLSTTISAGRREPTTLGTIMTKTNIPAKGAIVQRDMETYAIHPHIPGGFADPALLRKIADVAEKYGAKYLNSPAPSASSSSASARRTWTPPGTSSTTPPRPSA